MALSKGTLLAHYRVIGGLGAGGMGEVDDAEDTRLKRRVALKILPAAATDDQDRYLRNAKRRYSPPCAMLPIVRALVKDLKGELSDQDLEKVAGGFLDKNAECTVAGAGIMNTFTQINL